MRGWPAALIGAALVVAACGDASPTTTLAAAEFPAASFLIPRVLEPGRYRTTVMSPPVTAELGEGWTLLGEFPPLLILSRTVGPDRQRDFLDFVTFPGADRETVAGLVRDVEGVVAGEPEARVIGGRDATEFTADVVITGGGDVEVFAFPNDALYNQVPLDAPRFADGDRVRFTLVTVGEDTVLILAGTDRDLDYGDFITRVDEVLARTAFG